MGANPYVQGWREWDERYADPVIGKRNWQITLGRSLLVSLVLAVGSQRTGWH
jgi:type IV secretory pathway TrbF-like protein